ncbi:MAG: hypothetical protein WCA16_05955, partial [Candidatus Sulfotelmatobacter sp.]
LQLEGGARTVALGYIRREVGLPGREVKIGGAAAVVAELPLEAFATEYADLAVQPQPAGKSF